MTTGPKEAQERIDTEIRKSAANLFELDDRSKLILACIARDGPQTIYELDKHGELSKAAIHRRLFGNGMLLERCFLRLEGKVTFDRITRYEKKYYGLDLKGFLASLSEVECKRNYMFNVLIEACCDNYASRNSLKFNDEQRTDFLDNARKRMKTDIATFLSYHSRQDLKLTHITNPLLYYLRFCLAYASLTESDFDPNLPLSLLNESAASIEKTPSAIFDDPWFGPFASCWVTRQEMKRLDINPRQLDPDLLIALLNAYGRVIRKLRDGNDPPWDHGLLYIGRSLRELKKDFPEITGE
jgi:hypothetical protein